MRSRRRSDSLLRVAGITIWAVTAATTLGSCNTSGCIENQNSIPLAGFYSYTTGQAISIDSVAIGGVGAPDDSLLNTGRAVSTIYLPLRSTAHTTSFYIRYLQRNMDGMADTISFSYDSEPRFVSEDCGAMYFYRITSVSHTSLLIDSIGITDSLITNADIERIRIYFRTNEDPELL